MVTDVTTGLAVVFPVLITVVVADVITVEVTDVNAALIYASGSQTF